MKKRNTLLSLVLIAALLIGSAAAAGGEAADPLISLDFLVRMFTPSLEESIDKKLTQDDDALLENAKNDWQKAVAAAEAVADAEHDAQMREARFKQGDMISGLTGTQVLPVAGTVSVSFEKGAVIDLSSGEEIAPDAELLAGHRYLVAEDTVAVFSITTKTAVLNYCGTYHLSLSEKPDYNAMAAALRTLSLFRGSDNAFGEGFDLEKTPNRIESLIMLIRMLGEEQYALACTSPHPFVDVPEWCNCYVAYAYEKGYSNGVGRDRYGNEIFGTYMESSAVIYTEFMLRALSYSSTATADISDALVRALNVGLLTDGERDLLESTSFLRADVVYLSYYALSMEAKGSEVSLHRLLSEAGVFSNADYRAAQAMVTTKRIR